MHCNALLMGDPGRWPFVGHLRVRHGAAGSGMALAARLSDEDRSAAYLVARRVELGVRRRLLGLPVPADRHGWLRCLWDSLLDLGAEDWSEAQRASLQLLVVAWDSQGQGVSGLGLSGVWAAAEGALVPLVDPGHPLLGGPGLPESVPGVLTLDLSTDRVVACPSHLRPAPIALDAVDQRCGVRP